MYSESAVKKKKKDYVENIFLGEKPVLYIYE